MSIEDQMKLLSTQHPPKKETCCETRLMTITCPMWLRQMKNMMLSLDLCAKDVRAILAAIVCVWVCDAGPGANENTVHLLRYQFRSQKLCVPRMSHLWHTGRNHPNDLSSEP